MGGGGGGKWTEAQNSTQSCAQTNPFVHDFYVLFDFVGIMALSVAPKCLLLLLLCFLKSDSADALPASPLRLKDKHTNGIFRRSPRFERRVEQGAACVHVNVSCLKVLNHNCSAASRRQQIELQCRVCCVFHDCHIQNPDPFGFLVS